MVSDSILSCVFRQVKEGSKLQKSLGGC